MLSKFTKRQILFPWRTLTLLTFATYVFAKLVIHEQKVLMERLHGSKNVFDPRAEWKMRNDWIVDDPPNFCESLKENPRPCIFSGDKDVKCTHKTKGKVMFSQNYQDYYLYTRHFKYMTRPGVYMDVAANSPIIYSNTFFLDRCLGWKGVCVEANDKYFEGLFKERSCMLVPTCVSDRDDVSVEFNLDGVYGGIVNKDYKYVKEATDGNKEILKKKLHCVSLHTLSLRFGITKVDYLSLDIEGNELNALKGINWDAVRIDVISVEIGPKFYYVEAFLAEHSYVRHEINVTEFERLQYPNFMKSDAIFVHESVEFGKPV